LLPPLGKKGEPIGSTHQDALKAKRIATFISQLSLAIIARRPMWLIVLYPARYTALVTTTICVSLSALLMAWYLEQTNSVLSVTAADAAVLVVFVGATRS
jgi:hypothetical protein